MPSARFAAARPEADGRLPSYNRRMRPRYRWQLRSRSLDLGERTLLMGVVNVTPDSFYDGGSFISPDKAVEHGLRLLDEGADILDIGGESTRPGAHLTGDAPAAPARPGVSAQEELRRVMPVLEGILRVRPDAVLSVDTYKATVAQAAVAAGAEIVNDVSAFQWDPQMAAAIADLKCGVVLMHTRGRPEEWRKLPVEHDLPSLVEAELASRAQGALEQGIERSRIVLDPGFGFGKNFEENYPLLAHLERLQPLGFPVLAGTSRKSFVGRTISKRTDREVPPSERLFGSLAAMVASILHGAHVVRVHDVRASVEAAAIADQILAAGP